MTEEPQEMMRRHNNRSQTGRTGSRSTVYITAALLSLLLFAPGLTGCGDDDAEEFTEETETRETPARESGFGMSTEEAIDEINDVGERYVVTLRELETVEDIEEHREELIGLFSAMQELDAVLKERQTEITAILDTNARSVALNNQLRTEMMRIVSDSAMATRLMELKASVADTVMPQEVH